MARSSISYLFVAVVASHFAVASSALAQVRLSGQVLATDECQLSPASAMQACAMRVIPIEGELSLRRRGTLQRVVVSLDRYGNFSKTLPAGSYTVRLFKPMVGSQRLKRSAYRITPSRIAITSPPSRSSRASQMALFVVAHRSRQLGPSIGISDGFQKPM
jgi:hypothetical protein